MTGSVTQGLWSAASWRPHTPQWFSTLRNVRCAACEGVEIASTLRRSGMSSGSGRLAIVALREDEEFARSRLFCRVVEHHDLVVRNALESQVLCGFCRVDNGLRIDAR